MSKYMLEFNGRWSAHLWEGDRKLRHPVFRFTDGDGGLALKGWLEKNGSAVKVQPFTPKTAAAVKFSPENAPAPKRAASPKAAIMPGKVWKVQLKTTSKNFTDGEEAAAYCRRYGGRMAEVML